MIDSGLGKHFHTFPVNLWCAHSPCSSPARHFVAIFPACSAWGYHPTTATLRWSHCFLSNDWEHLGLPSGKRLHNYGKSPFLMGKSTISMVIFNSYVSHYQRVDKSFLPSSGPVGPVKPTAFVRVCPKQTLNLDEAGAGLYPAAVQPGPAVSLTVAFDGFWVGQWGNPSCFDQQTWRFASTVVKPGRNHESLWTH